jgi:hypothetical protein
MDDLPRWKMMRFFKNSLIVIGDLSKEKEKYKDFSK